MPGSTGPDLNTYTIPEVQLGDTFNVWRDASNTAIYKLNKLKVYDANTDSNAASIGATYTTAGVWNAFLQPTVTSGHTFSGLIQFIGGISASAGFTLGGNAWIVGGVSLGGVLTVGGTAALSGNVVLGDAAADQITVNGVFVNGLTATGPIRANSGLTATTLDVTTGARIVGGLSASALYASTGSTFAAAVVVVGGLSASAVYASAGSTFGSTVYIGGGVTANSTLNVTGAVRLNNTVVMASSLYQSGGSAQLLSGLTASTLDVTTGARIIGGLSASALYASTGSTFGSTVYVGGGVTFASVSDHVGAARFSGGLSASALYASAGSTFGSTLYVGGGVTFASTLNTSGNAVLNGTLNVAGAAALNSTLVVTAATQLNSTLNVVGVSVLAGTTASTLDVSGTAKIIGGVTAASTLDVVGNTRIGFNAAGSTLGVSGSVFLQAQTPLRFGDADSSHYVGFRAPATVSGSVLWTLPATDGSNGQVLSTNSTGTLSWKAADGVTGLDKQIQFNIGGLPAATGGLVFEYSTAGGFSAGTLGVSGGAYIMGNVGIGITTPAIGARIFDVNTSSTAKLEVRGDIRIPSGGFFVNKNITIPAGVCAGIGADENAFLSGVLTVASGATLSISTGGTLVVL